LAKSLKPRPLYPPPAPDRAARRPGSLQAGEEKTAASPDPPLARSSRRASAGDAVAAAHLGAVVRRGAGRGVGRGALLHQLGVRLRGSSRARVRRLPARPHAGPARPRPADRGEVATQVPRDGDGRA
ncbi:MAG: hypothetical protein ACK56I_16465, partial [bacterium]